MVCKAAGLVIQDALDDTDPIISEITTRSASSSLLGCVDIRAILYDISTLSKILCPSKMACFMFQDR